MTFLHVSVFNRKFDTDILKVQVTDEGCKQNISLGHE